MPELFTKEDWQTLGNLVEEKYSSFATGKNLGAFLEWLENSAHQLMVPEPETIVLSTHELKALKSLSKQLLKTSNLLDQIPPNLNAVLESRIAYSRYLTSMIEPPENFYDEEIVDMDLQDQMSELERRESTLAKAKDADLTKYSLEELSNTIEAELLETPRGVKADKALIRFTQNAIHIYNYTFGKQPAKSDHGLFQDIFDVFLQRMSRPRHDLKYLVTRALEG